MTLGAIHKRGFNQSDKFGTGNTLEYAIGQGQLHVIQGHVHEATDCLEAIPDATIILVLVVFVGLIARKDDFRNAIGSTLKQSADKGTSTRANVGRILRHLIQEKRKHDVGQVAKRSTTNVKGQDWLPDIGQVLQMMQSRRQSSFGCEKSIEEVIDGCETRAVNPASNQEVNAVFENKNVPSDHSATISSEPRAGPRKVMRCPTSSTN